jgi:hypothetical protein
LIVININRIHLIKMGIMCSGKLDYIVPIGYYEGEFSEKMVLHMQLHYSRLSDWDRRQNAALESLKLCRECITCISRILEADRKTTLPG